MDSTVACSRGDACAVVTTRDVAALAEASTIVLDSWHLYDGTAVAVDRHRARFRASVAAVFGVAEEEGGSSYDHAVGHLPRSGSWFPAFVWTDEGLRLVVRPFPVEQLRRTTTLSGEPALDARKQPGIKGIDHLWQLGRRAAVTASGYDEELLVTSAGLVSEAIFATLVLVEGSELVVPSSPRLESVTLSVIREQAESHGFTVRESPVTIGQLTEADTLLTLSALHGVRAVTRLGTVEIKADSAIRDALQRSWEAARRPLLDGIATCASC